MNEELNFKIRAITEGMDQAMKKATSELNALGNAYSDTDKKAKTATTATEDLKRKKQEETEATKNQRNATQASNDELAKVAAIAAVAGAAFFGIVSAINAGIAAYNQYTAAMTSLQGVAASTGNSMADLAKITDKLTSDGLMTVSDVSLAIKNLLMYGYTADQAADILDRLKDSAAFNRQAHYSLGEAVKMTTEGIRMENSILSDAAGVTKNIAKMYLEYAQAQGISSDTMTKTQKAQAVYNGIMTETEVVVGNAAKYTASFAGQQSALEMSQKKLNIAYGDAVTGGLLPFVSALIGGTEAMTEFIENNRVAVSVISTMVTTAVGLIAVLGVGVAAIQLFGVSAVTASGGVAVLSASFTALWAAVTGPIGWVIAGITVLVGVITGISAAAEEAKKKAAELRAEIESLSKSNKSAADLVTEYETLARQAYKTAEDTQRMLDIRAELVSSYGFSAAAIDNEGRLLAGNLEIMKQQLDVQRQTLLEKMQANAINEENAYNAALAEQAAILADIAKYEGRILDPSPVIGVGRDQETIDAWVTKWRSIISDLNKELAELRKTAAGNIINMIEIMVMELERGGKKVPAAVQSEVIDAVNDALKSGFSYDDVAATAQGIFDTYFAINDNVVQSETIPMIQELRAEIIAALAKEGNDAGQSTEFANQLLNTILGDAAQQAALKRVTELRQLIVDGLATTADMNEFDGLQTQIFDAFTRAVDLAHDGMAELPAGASEAASAIYAMQQQFAMSAESITKASVAAEAAKMVFKDAADELKSSVQAQENATKSISEVANLKAAVDAIKEYNTFTVKSAEITTMYANAKAYLADAFGIEQDAIVDMLPDLEDQIALKEAMVIADYALAMQAVESSRITVQTMLDLGRITPEQGALMITAIDKVIAKMAELAISVNGNSVVPGNVPAPKKTGTYKNTALEKELALLEHKKALNQLTTAEEIAALEKILAKYAKTTDEKRDLTEKLYDLRMEKMRADLEYKKSMDQLTLREEIAAITAMIAQYKVGTDARRDLEVELYEAQKELKRQEFDLAVYYGQLTLSEQAAALETMIAQYKAGTQERIELEKQLFDVQGQIRQAGIDQLERLTAGVIDALQSRYDEQREAENARLKSSADAWAKWSTDQVAAIKAQIDAIDGMSESEDKAEQERVKRRNIAMLEQQLLYEKDAYNRQKIQEQLVKAQADLTKWLTEQERAELKKALQGQIDAVQETANNEQDKINAQIDANNAYYDKLTEQARLQAEASALIMQSSQDEILALLQNYAADYNLTGQTLGEQLYDGFMAKVGDLETWFDTLSDRFSSFRAELDAVATAAAANFYATQAAATAAGNAPVVGGSTTQTFILNFNSPVTSPTEIKREMERLATQLANM